MSPTSSSLSYLPDEVPSTHERSFRGQEKEQQPDVGHYNAAFDLEDVPSPPQCDEESDQVCIGTLEPAGMEDAICSDGTFSEAPASETTLLRMNCGTAAAPVSFFHREIMDMTQMEKKFGFQTQVSDSERISRWTKSKCRCQFSWFLALLVSLFPVITWLPKYRLKYLLLDAISGFTIAILHIPQGMAYGILASVGAENGLYVSFFPVLIYFVLGTSKHASIGTFAVISLMLNSAVTNMGAVHSREHNVTHPNTSDALNYYTVLEPPTNLEVVTSMAMAVGLWQIFMAVFQLGSLTVLLSDQLISGFTTGAAVHVGAAQMKYLFGIPVGSYSGALKLIYTYRDVFSGIAKSNCATLIVSAVAIFVLAVFKEHIDGFFRKKFKMPFPIDLVVVISATAVSHFGDFNEVYDVDIVGDIPTGLPSPVIPRMDLLPHLVTDSLAIAVVIFVVSLSMAKLFAKKHKYTISPTQELIALGSANAISSFFACFPSSISLARSTVQESSGGQTQITGVISCGFLLIVLLFLAPMFYNLPKCILSAVILVALKRIFMQVKDFTRAWKMSKIDAMLWLVTFLGSVLLDISYGLLIGVIFSIATVIFRTAVPSRAFLGNIPDTDLYLDLRRYSLAKEIPGVRIFRFESALYFINRQQFRTCLLENVPFCRRNTSASEVDEKTSDMRVHHVIIDCSSFSYVDMSGLETLIEVAKEYKEAGITIFLSGCSVSMYDLMVRGNFFTNIPYQPCIFPTIHDAVGFCFHPVIS